MVHSDAGGAARVAKVSRQRQTLAMSKIALTIAMVSRECGSLAMRVAPPEFNETASPHPIQVAMKKCHNQTEAWIWCNISGKVLEDLECCENILKVTQGCHGRKETFARSPESIATLKQCTINFSTRKINTGGSRQWRQGQYQLVAILLFGRCLRDGWDVTSLVLHPSLSGSRKTAGASKYYSTCELSNVKGLPELTMLVRNAETHMCDRQLY